MASASVWPFSRARTLSILTTAQHASAMVFGTFVLVHLAAPAVAGIAPQGEALDLSTKTMILGRVYYQNVFTEPTVVYGAALVHVASSLAKRLLALWHSVSKRRKRATTSQESLPYSIPDSDSEEQPSSAQDRGTVTQASPRSWSIFRSLPSLHTSTGLVLIPALFTHVRLNRIVPSRDLPPIHELSPSELDYSYVTHGFSVDVLPAWRYVSWGLYGSLLVAAAFHIVSGVDTIAQRRILRKRARGDLNSATHSHTSSREQMRIRDQRATAQRRAWGRTIVSMGGILWLGWGLARMSKEVSGVGGSFANRIRACYAQVWPYSLW